MERWYLIFLSIFIYFHQFFKKIYQIFAGPSLPTQFGLFGHEMVSIGYDLIVIGGDIGGGSFSGSIYKLSCSNFVCKWEKLQMELKVPRARFTAIPLPDDFISCI